MPFDSSTGCEYAWIYQVQVQAQAKLKMAEKCKAVVRKAMTTRKEQHVKNL